MKLARTSYLSTEALYSSPDHSGYFSSDSNAISDSLDTFGDGNKTEKKPNTFIMKSNETTLQAQVHTSLLERKKLFKPGRLTNVSIVAQAPLTPVTSVSSNSEHDNAHSPRCKCLKCNKSYVMTRHKMLRDTLSSFQTSKFSKSGSLNSLLSSVNNNGTDDSLNIDFKCYAVNNDDVLDHPYVSNSSVLFKKNSKKGCMFKGCRFPNALEKHPCKDDMNGKVCRRGNDCKFYHKSSMIKSRRMSNLYDDMQKYEDFLINADNITV